MGQEVNNSFYSEEDSKKFFERLEKETKLLETWFSTQKFEHQNAMTGIELEAWLVDNDMLPDPIGPDFLDKLNSSQVVPEISRFNFEINSKPHLLQGKVFSNLYNEMKSLWDECSREATGLNANPLMMGTLATLRANMLSLEYISPNNRYSVMNEQVMKFRGGKPLHIELQGKDEIYLEMDSVIAECAATSLQIHLGVKQDEAKRYYNASLLASPFLVALSANSPYFFGRELWDESRIMVFEQAVEMESVCKSKGSIVKRVTMGEDYVKNSLFELFKENIEDYPVLLPESLSTNIEELSHLKLHNGTIWRWTRPIIGENPDGSPHLRIEQRTPSAGPTIHDSIANSVFFLGLCDYFAKMDIPPEDLLSFQDNLDNFYKTSRQSLYCRVKWIDGKLHDIVEIILFQFLPEVKKALLERGIDKEDISFYIDHVIKGRLTKGINGACWQKAWIHTHGKKFQQLLEVYLENQNSGTPVHEWRV